jgi:hypothetical protein
LAPTSRALRSDDCASAKRCVGGGNVAAQAPITGSAIINK